jgi:hypothetical protein
MKVVIFCGGLGMRLREYSESVPKPMVTVGYRPIVWYIMRYYAHFGYRDFILCLGYKADTIKNYFRNYDETISNDFVRARAEEGDLLTSDIRTGKSPLSTPDELQHRTTSEARAAVSRRRGDVRELQRRLSTCRFRRCSRTSRRRRTPWPASRASRRQAASLS